MRVQIPRVQYGGQLCSTVLRHGTQICVQLVDAGESGVFGALLVRVGRLDLDPHGGPKFLYIVVMQSGRIPASIDLTKPLPKEREQMIISNLSSLPRVRLAKVGNNTKLLGDQRWATEGRRHTGKNR